MQDRRRPPRGRADFEPKPVRKPSAGELANLHKLALQWRDEWRAKTSVPVMPPAKPALVVRKRPARKTAAADGGFAAAIARAEFGRFYWNAKLDGQLMAAMRSRSDGSIGVKDKRNGKARG